ncbi:MAG: PAS domain S-box protein [Nitrospirae bacterium]|nr:PAS domain S-box protein [Nitrospirota bacterium]
MLICTVVTLTVAALLLSLILYNVTDFADERERAKAMLSLQDVVARLHADTMHGEAMGAALLMGLNEPLIKAMAKERLSRDDKDTLLRMVAAKRLFGADGIFIVNAAGVIVAHESDVKRSTGMDMSERSYVKQAAANSTSVYPAISISTGDKVFYTSAPIHQGQTVNTPVIGTLTMRIPADPVIIKHMEMLPGQALLLSPDGIVFASTRHSWVYASAKLVTKKLMEEIRKERRYGKIFDNKSPEALPFDITSTSAVLEGKRYAISRELFDWNDLGGLWQLVVIQDTKEWVTTLHIAIVITATVVGCMVFGFLLYIILRQRERKTQDDIRIKKLSSAIETSPIMVMITNTNGIIEYINEAFVKTTGYTAAEAIGNKPQMLKSGLTPEETYRSLWAALRAGQSWQGEFINRCKGDALCTVFSTITPLTDENGTVVNYVCLQENITWRKQLDEALRKSQQRLSLLVQNSPLGIIEWDINNKVTAWNPAAEHIFGYTKEEAMGHLASEIIIPEDAAPRVHESLTAAGATAPDHQDNITKDGRRIACCWHNVTLTDETGSAIGVASLVEDATNRRNMMAELRQHVKDLERFNRLTVDREERMIQLKREINNLYEKLGLTAKYKIVS